MHLTAANARYLVAKRNHTWRDLDLTTTAATDLLVECTA